MKVLINKIIKWIKDNSYFLIILSILLTVYFINFNSISKLNIYNFVFYTFSYNFGFISRGLIGSIFSLFLGYITIKKVYFILNIVFIIFLIFIAYILNLFIKKSKEKETAFLTMLLCIFTPASFMLMITGNEFGRLDIFIYILSIIAFIIIYKKRYLIFIPLIFIFAMFIHQNFLFMYAPLILSILIYNWVKERNEKWLVLFLVSFLCLTFSFFLILKFGKPTNFKNAEEFAIVLREKTNIPISSSNFGAIDAEYFKSIKEHFKLTQARLKITPKKNFVIGLFLLISYLYIQFILCYKEILKKYKYSTFLLIFSCFGSLPLFFIGVDFGRWYIAIINSLVLLFVYLMFDNMKEREKSFKINKSNQFLLIGILIFYILIMQDTSFTFMDFSKINGVLNKLKKIILILIS
ncbi:MAG: hypothetical protein ACOXZR_00015 [Bacilli bacterium]|jgi:hypothetical protein